MEKAREGTSGRGPVRAKAGRWDQQATSCLGCGGRHNRGRGCWFLKSWLETFSVLGVGGPPVLIPGLFFSPLQDRSLTGKLEPVSPPSPPHADPELELVPPRLSKEELIQNMDRVDREITMVEQQISKLKKKQVWVGEWWISVSDPAAAMAEEIT